MSEGLVKQRIREMRENWKKRRDELFEQGLINPNLQPEDVFEILDEATKEFPLYPVTLEFGEVMFVTPEDVVQEWFKRWFVDSGEKKR